MKAIIKIIIAEDLAGYRQIIKAEFEGSDFNIQVLAEVENGIELLRLLKTLSPDIILLDLKMPELNGNHTLTIVSEKYPDIKIIILSSYDEQVLIDDYFLRGVKGYVPKSQLSELVGAIGKVHRGGIYKFHSGEQTESAITARHKEILALYGEGKTQAEIAKILGVSRIAVWKSERKIMELLKLSTKTEFLTAIMEKGLKFIGRPFFP